MIMTYTGKMVDPFDLKPDDVDLEDIAHSLSLMNRYTGHTTFPYSVAQHSILLSEAVPPRLAQVALLHDASEAYLVDVPYPIKQRLPDFQDLEHRIQITILTKYGIDPNLLDELHIYDRAICVDEMRHLMDHVPENMPKPLRIMIREMDWRTVEDWFYERFYELF